MRKEDAMKTIPLGAQRSLAHVQTQVLLRNNTDRHTLCTLHLRKHTAILEKVAAYPSGVRKCQVMK